MKVLVVGNGGREHAIAWKLLQSDRVTQVFCAPGNGGTATLNHTENIAVAVDDFASMADFIRQRNIDLVVVGPEVPLAGGITDYLQKQGIKVFGPTQAGAQIEASKAWAKALMQAGGIPTAKSEVFTDVSAAKSYLRSQGLPIVVKADGLAAGKGVIIAETIAEAEAALDSIFGGLFGSAGNSVVIEEYLVGQEVSVLALTDGVTIIPLLPAQDHKRIGEGDTGENTGGMGAYTPTPIATPELMARVQTEVLEATIAALREKGIDYRGVLYAGLMVAEDGSFRVLEFNCRFGDPETQVVLPMLETPLDELILACVEQRLGEMPPLKWKNGAAATVVVASGGYPGKYEKGQTITGINEAESSEVTVFHAGTKLESGQIITDGGRVLNVTATGTNFSAALASAYTAIAKIKFANMYFRRDIGHRVLSGK